jgi:hypothetical protein
MWTAGVFANESFCGVAFNRLYCPTGGVRGEVLTVSIEFVLLVEEELATGDVVFALTGTNFLPKFKNGRRWSSGTSSSRGWKWLYSDSDIVRAAAIGNGDACVSGRITVDGRRFLRDVETI